tara:strand:+ start:4577 stop:5317 length:741 start_codon:yes stop_codon:yes gene_type:complete
MKHYNLTTTDRNGKSITTTNTSTEYPEELLRMLALSGSSVEITDDGKCGCGEESCGCGDEVEALNAEAEYRAAPANDELDLDDFSKKTANSISMQKKTLQPSRGDNPLEYSTNEGDIYEALMLEYDTMAEDTSFRDRDNFVTAYISAAEELADDEFEDGDIDWNPEALAQMEKDAETFYSKAEKLLQTLDADPRQHGYDFWLTRNGHGAGFWDRGYGEAGDKLSAFAEKFGQVTVYKGDDGKAYIG